MPWPRNILSVISEYIDPRAPFFDLYPELLDIRVHQDYDKKTRTINGLKHSLNDEPFIENVGKRFCWYRFGQLHRDYGPAVIRIRFNASDEVVICGKTQEEIFRYSFAYEYYYRGLRHRDDGPAIVENEYEAWYRYGFRAMPENNIPYFTLIKANDIPEYIARRHSTYPVRSAHGNYTMHFYTASTEYVRGELNRFENHKAEYDQALKTMDDPESAAFLENAFSDTAVGKENMGVGDVLGVAMYKRDEYMNRKKLPKLSTSEQEEIDERNLIYLYALYERLFE